MNHKLLKQNRDILLHSYLAKTDGVLISTLQLEISLHHFMYIKDGLTSLLGILNGVNKFVSLNVISKEYEMWHEVGYYDSIDDCIMKFNIVRE